MDLLYGDWDILSTGLRIHRINQEFRLSIFGLSGTYQQRKAHFLLDVIRCVSSVTCTRNFQCVQLTRPEMDRLFVFFCQRCTAPNLCWNFFIRMWEYKVGINECVNHNTNILCVSSQNGQRKRWSDWRWVTPYLNKQNQANKVSMNQILNIKHAE